MSNAVKKGMIGKSPISVGRFTYGLENISVLQWNEGAALKIGAFCSIAKNISVFLGGNHRVDWITTFPFGHIYQTELGEEHLPGHPATNGDVEIGDDVWIGNGVSIMSGVMIGTGAVIAANSHVVKDVLPYEIVGGNPAKLIKKRFNPETVYLLLKLSWWDLPLDSIKEIKPILCSKPSTKALQTLIDKYREDIFKQ